jgi:hypothetical protein
VELFGLIRGQPGEGSVSHSSVPRYDVVLPRLMSRDGGCHAGQAMAGVQYG